MVGPTRRKAGKGKGRREATPYSRKQGMEVEETADLGCVVDERVD